MPNQEVEAGHLPEMSDEAISGYNSQFEDHDLKTVFSTEVFQPQEHLLRAMHNVSNLSVPDWNKQPTALQTWYNSAVAAYHTNGIVDESISIRQVPYNPDDGPGQVGGKDVSGDSADRNAGEDDHSEDDGDDDGEDDHSEEDDDDNLLDDSTDDGIPSDKHD